MLYTIEDIERILETYSLEDILEINEVQESDLLYFLMTEGYLKLPEPEPLI